MLAAAASEAAPKKDFRRKPVAPEVTAKVLRGRSVVIRLPGVESNGNPIRYEIVSRPSSGKLSNLEQPDPNRQGHGFVTYTHGDDESSVEDGFQYQVITPISGLTSSPGSVTIRIVDLPPLLGAQSFLNFSAIVGESATATLALTNIGGGTLHGEVRVAPPFFLDAEGAFALKRGQSTNLPLRYTPTETGLSAPEKIQPALEDPATSITLRGEATAPFAVKTTSERLDLKADDSRSVSVELANLSSLPQKVNVSVTPPELLEEIPPVSLAPGESREILLRIPPGHKGAAENFTAVFSTQAYSQNRVFTAPPVPARLEVLTAEIDFVSTREAALTVRNSGGVEGRFSISLPAGVTTIEGAAAFSVPPDGEKSVRLRLSPKKNESPPAELLVTASTGESERVAIRTAPVETPEPTPEATPQPPAPLPPAPARPGILNDNVRLVKNDTRQHLKWNLPPEWNGVQAEMRDASGMWHPPSPPVETGGWWDALTSIPRRILGFFSGMISRPDLDKIRPDTPIVQNPDTSWQGIEISGEDAKSGATWRLTAQAASTGERTPVTDAFIMDAEAGLLCASEQQPPPAPDEQAPTPPEPEQPTPEPEQPGQPAQRVTTGGTAILPPSTPLMGAQQEPGKKSCTVLLAIPWDAEVDGYRIERLVSSATIDPASGLPGQTEFQVIPHQGHIEIIARYQMQQDDQELSVIVFSIEGLPPDSGTFWRLVPIAGEHERPPTGEFVVRTLPPWRISWPSVLFWSALALLGGLFYLRWKSRQLPADS